VNTIVGSGATDVASVVGSDECGTLDIGVANAEISDHKVLRTNAIITEAPSDNLCPETGAGFSWTLAVIERPTWFSGSVSGAIPLLGRTLAAGSSRAGEVKALVPAKDLDIPLSTLRVAPSSSAGSLKTTEPR
jgi:hypothetical protein